MVALIPILLGSARIVAQARTAAMAKAGTTFLAELSEGQLSRAQLPFDTPERIRWHFVPPEVFPRAGIVLKDLSEQQLTAAHALLKASLSASGYQTATSIMALEDVLKELGQSGRFAREADAYYITVFGTPGNRQAWAWRFEGHHLSLHFTVVNGSVSVSTPTFLGASPAEVRHGPQRGHRALGTPEDAAFALLRSLDPAQRATAVLSDNAPSDILTGTDFPISPLAPAGLEAAVMTPTQQRLLRTLLQAHTSVMNTDIAAERWRRIDDAGLESIAFAWAGDTVPGRPHYYRIQGPTFLVEHDNTQNGANHIHIVWRDFDGDFGRDLLRDHLGAVRH
jgi:hypothetical protein